LSDGAVPFRNRRADNEPTQPAATAAGTGGDPCQEARSKVNARAGKRCWMLLMAVAHSTGNGSSPDNRLLAMAVPEARQVAQLVERPPPRAGPGWLWRSGAPARSRMRSGARESLAVGAVSVRVRPGPARAWPCWTPSAGSAGVNTPSSGWSSKRSVPSRCDSGCPGPGT
jgi:hypothetical protein